MSESIFKAVELGKDLLHFRLNVKYNFTTMQMADKFGVSDHTYRRLEVGTCNNIVLILQAIDMLNKRPEDYFIKPIDHTKENSFTSKYIDELELEVYGPKLLALLKNNP